MSVRRAAYAAVLLLGIAAAAPAVAARDIGWADLRPVAQPDMATVADAGEAGRTPTAALDNETVEITGYMIPSDREGDTVYEFLLVPWAGACSHMPAPAPNQVLRVHARTPFNALGNYEIVTVTGRLTGSRDLTQLFILDGVTVVESAYQLGATAIVSHGLPAPDATQAPHGRSPWSFMRP
jgi:hypothetical protein